MWVFDGGYVAVDSHMAYKDQSIHTVYFSNKNGRGWDTVDLKAPITNEDLFAILNKYLTKDEAWEWLRNATSDDLDVVVFNRVMESKI